jgi:hypothetical protein
MLGRRRVSGQLKPLRVRVEIGTPGSFLWASFGDHMKAGVVSLLPLVLLNIVAAAAEVEGDPAVAQRILQGFNSTGALVTTLGWVLIAACAAYCAVWAAMSSGLVRLFRFRPSFYVHLATHAVSGAIVTLALCLGILWLNVHDELAGAPLWQADTFVPLALGAPAVGAVGAALGMWTLKSYLGWYRLQEREPLKDVFTFVDGRHTKDEFERL